MSLWSNVKKFLGIGKRKEPAKPPVPPAPPKAPPKRNRGNIDRTVAPQNEDMDRVWDDMRDTLERRLTDRGVDAFNERQDRLMGLFDIISDPSQSDHIQTDAYDALADELADFGFTFRHGIDLIGDFDWVGFGAAYPKITE